MTDNTKSKNEDLEPFKFNTDPLVKATIKNIERMRDLWPVLEITELEMARHREMKLKAMQEAGMSREEAVRLLVAEVGKPPAPKNPTNPLAALLGQ